MPGFIKCKVINHAQLRKANRYAIDNKCKRYREEIDDLKRIPKDKIYQLSPRYIDRLSLEKIEYLRTQLVDNPNLVIVALLYDGFHMKEGHETYGWHSTPERAKRILARLFRKDINWNRVAFFYSDCTPGVPTHEHLLSTDRRLELLVYELLLE